MQPRFEGAFGLGWRITERLVVVATVFVRKDREKKQNNPRCDLAVLVKWVTGVAIVRCAGEKSWFFRAVLPRVTNFDTPTISPVTWSATGTHDEGLRPLLRVDRRCEYCDLRAIAG